MRAHAISHTNPFIAHLAYVGFTYQFCTPPRLAVMPRPLLPPNASWRRGITVSVSANVLCRSRAGLGRGYLCLACGPGAAFFIGHITKDYSNNGATNSFVPSENNRAVPGSLTFTFPFTFTFLFLFRLLFPP